MTDEQTRMIRNRVDELCMMQVSQLIESAINKQLPQLLRSAADAEIKRMRHEQPCACSRRTFVADVKAMLSEELRQHMRDKIAPSAVRSAVADLRACLIQELADKHKERAERLKVQQDEVKDRERRVSKIATELDSALGAIRKAMRGAER